ncbi:MAG: hypothetical protein O7B25_15285 [Gammaproteobacteria bacterium]|nr:hypothetical protein [Gammaproteobacteria bacterium]
MKRLTRAVIVLFLATFISTPALAAPEDEPGYKAMTGDLIVARPLGMAFTAIGAAIFVVSLPFTALAGNIDRSADVLVTKPAAETFMRCLGCKTSGSFRAGAN